MPGVEGVGSPAISPWHVGPVRVVSPDGTRVAVMDEASEIAMGAPTRGTLRLGDQAVEDCNPSMVWSEDSCFLAVPKWTYHGKSPPNQRLLIVCPERGWVRHAPGAYHVLELERFAGGAVRGIDSPVWNPRPIAIDVSRLLV